MRGSMKSRATTTTGGPSSGRSTRATSASCRGTGRRTAQRPRSRRAAGTQRALAAAATTPEWPQRPRTATAMALMDHLALGTLMAIGMQARPSSCPWGRARRRSRGRAARGSYPEGQSRRRSRGRATRRICPEGPSRRRSRSRRALGRLSRSSPPATATARRRRARTRQQQATPPCRTWKRWGPRRTRRSPRPSSVRTTSSSRARAGTCGGCARSAWTFRASRGSPTTPPSATAGHGQETHPRSTILSASCWSRT
mmetsp:Transcript_22070/g.63667  ORF Transcript_22070/g.63667 Transcript_22070/m.63667 type:complete len:255 (-) Transcript_22070:198-962(-)